MIYTLGHKETYLKLFKNTKPPKRPYKLGRYLGYQGGSVWKTREEVEAYIETCGLDTHAVFGVEADWEADTAPHFGMPFHDLLIDAPLVKLGEEKDGI